MHPCSKALNPTRFALALTILALLAGQAVAQSLNERVRTLVSNPKLGQCKTGVVVMDPLDGRVLAAHRADEALIPASNMKLLTSGAALAVLGPNFDFKTDLIFDPSYRVAAQGDNPPVTAGRITLRGSGDPTLGDPVLLEKNGRTVENVLADWISAMKAAGIGPGAELVLDDRVFDREMVHPSWPTEQLVNWYCCEVSGVTFHTNVLRVFLTPQAAGRPPLVKVEPAAPWLEIKNRGRSIGKGSQTAWVQRDAGNRLVVHGDVRRSNDAMRLSIDNTPEFVLMLLADRMRAAGMSPARARLASLEEDLAGGKTIHTISTPIADVLERCNVDSHNLYAEALLKRLGYEVTHEPGSWATGAAVIRMTLSEKLGIEAGQRITVADGSGMSRQNRVTPRLLARWLSELQADAALAPIFIESLPTAGEEGTLRKRFQKAPLVCDVRAKSGYISGVSALSGYVIEPTSGRKLIFVAITNDRPNSVPLSLVWELQEKVVRLCDTWLRDKAAGEPRQNAGRR